MKLAILTILCTCLIEAEIYCLWHGLRGLFKGD